MTAVSFCLQFDTQYGQRMRLVGSHHNLGEGHALFCSAASPYPGCHRTCLVQVHAQQQTSKATAIHKQSMSLYIIDVQAHAEHPGCIAGAWQLRDGPDLSWTEGNNWRAVIELPAGTVHEYKYVLLNSHSGQALNWQRGNNSVLAIKAGEDRIEVRLLCTGLP